MIQTMHMTFSESKRFEVTQMTLFTLKSVVDVNSLPALIL